jgi:hypothetical protein
VEGISQQLADEIKDRINIALEIRLLSEEQQKCMKDIERIIQSYVLHEK